MKKILSFLEMIFLFLLGLLLTPFAYLIWLRWQRHEWKALGPSCSQGYDYETNWIDILNEELTSDRSADA